MIVASSIVLPEANLTDITSMRRLCVPEVRQVTFNGPVAAAETVVFLRLVSISASVVLKWSDAFLLIVQMPGNTAGNRGSYTMPALTLPAVDSIIQQRIVQCLIQRQSK